MSCWRPPRRQPMGQHKPALGFSFSLKSLRYLFPIPTIGSRQAWRSPSLLPHLDVGFTCWCFQGHIRRKVVSGCGQGNSNCVFVDIGSCWLRSVKPTFASKAKGEFESFEKLLSNPSFWWAKFPVACEFPRAKLQHLSPARAGRRQGETGNCVATQTYPWGRMWK